jgi:hypothetical protein
MHVATSHSYFGTGGCCFTQSFLVFFFTSAMKIWFEQWRVKWLILRLVVGSKPHHYCLLQNPCLFFRRGGGGDVFILPNTAQPRAISQAAELVEVHNRINSGYHLQNPTEERHVFSALTIKEARTLYGDTLIDAASTEDCRTASRKECGNAWTRTTHSKTLSPRKC